MPEFKVLRNCKTNAKISILNIGTNLCDEMKKTETCQVLIVINKIEKDNLLLNLRFLITISALIINKSRKELVH